MSDKPATGSRKLQSGRRIANRTQSSAASTGTQASRRDASRTRPSTPTAGAAGATARSARAKQKKNLINYPRAGKKGLWRWFPSLRMCVLAFALLVFAGLGGAVWLYNDTQIPEANDVALAQTSRVYFADGTTLMGEFSDINRTIIPGSEIPQTVKDAVVASEDSSFYENRGISPKGIMRALVNNLQGGARQGGSTITQQYVENYYTGRVTSYSGKAREMVMAIKADQELSKDEILSRYLNTIYFGRSAYGIQAAAQTYFGKDAKDLNAEEAALLVAVIPAPTQYDPANDPKKAQDLWARVINRQVNDTKTLTPAEADAMQFPKVLEYKPKNTLGGTNGYLLDAVKKELVAEGMTADQVDTGGYTIISTIDPAVQKNTVDAVNAMPEDRPVDNRVGTLTLEPQTGAIVAMYGGPDFVTQPRNDATQSHMQAGSIFKSFTLVAAINEGYSLYSTWDGNSPKDFNGWPVKNFGDISYGRVNLLTSTEKSINTSFAALNLDMGPAKTKDAAIALGLPEDTPGLNADATNVLGTASPSVKAMATAYGTLAAGGVRHDPFIVQKVTNSDGSTAYEHKDDSKRVIDKDVATNVTVALQGPPSSGGSAHKVAEEMEGRPVAGKTGTSDSFHSAWFVGFTPQYVTAVGMFQPSPDGKTEQSLTPFGGEDNITGSTWPTRVWIDIMKSSLEGKEFLEFPEEVQVKRSTQQPSQSAPPAPSTRAPTKAPTRAPAPTRQTPVEPTTVPTPSARRTTRAPQPTVEPTTKAPETEPTTEAPQPTQEPQPEPTTAKPPVESPSSEPKEEPKEEPKPTQKPTSDTGQGSRGPREGTRG